MGKRASREPVDTTFAVDERLVMPETRFEVIDGEVSYVSPADAPHAIRHSKLSALLEAFVAEGYEVASDMLTRTSEKGDMAPDGSIFPSARDDATGGRRLEELAFEVVSTETLAHAAKKAAALSARGVRRIFALDVERRRTLEWSRRTGSWEILAKSAVIDDPALALPLAVGELVEAAKVDDAVARALLAKQNPVLVEALAEARGEAKAEGKAEGKIESILAVLAARRVPIDAAAEARIRALREGRALDRTLTRATRCESASTLFAPETTRKTPKRTKKAAK